MYSQCTCHVFLISQAWYIVKMLQVHSEWTNRKVLVELGQYIAGGLMDLKCPSLVCDGHMTWYIAKNIQNKLFKCILMAFCQNIQNILDNFWFWTFWSHDLVHFEHIRHYSKSGHCCHIYLIHLKYSRHMPVWYGVSSLSQNQQHTWNVLGQYITPCPQWLALVWSSHEERRCRYTAAFCSV